MGATHREKGLQWSLFLPVAGLDHFICFCQNTGDRFFRRYAFDIGFSTRNHGRFHILCRLFNCAHFSLSLRISS